MSFQFNQLLSVSKGKMISDTVQAPVKFLVTDSRSSNSYNGAVFFAIKGKNHDGHAYLKELYLKGFRQFVIEDEDFISQLNLTDSNVFLAESTVTTLQEIVIFHRNKFSLEVVGITGSNGKTIVKEWLNQLLAQDYTIVKSPKSYNSQIGVPLSVWQITPEHNLGIFEAGISKPGEMSILERIIQPSIGIFTNIGPAHSEGFNSDSQKIKEKALLFKNCKSIIYRNDDAEIDNYLKQEFDSSRLISWSLGKTSTYNVTVTKKEGRKTWIKIQTNSGSFSFLIPFSDVASFENIMHCIVLMLHFHIAETTINNRILSLNNIPMRLELKEGRNNSYIIDDTYNNDTEGLKIALQFMQQQNLRPRKILILSDMLESGKSDLELNKEIARLINENSIKLFIGIGEKLLSHSKLFPKGSLFFYSASSFLEFLDEINLSDAMVLIKGARIFRFETIVHALAHKIHRTVLEINLNSIAHNLNVFRRMLKPKTKMMVMVKAFAYGSGSHEVAHLLQYNNVDYLAVAYTDEGIALRESNITLPIMVMNPTPEEFAKIVHYKLEPEIYNFRLLNAFTDFIKQEEFIINNAYVPPVHIAIDTGMHRLGFEEGQVEELCEFLVKENIRVASVFSHLAGADEPHHDPFSLGQARLFKSITDRIEKAIKYEVIKHILNSAGITRLRENEFDMVRLGIGLYGIEAIDHPHNQSLNNVSTLKTVISQIRTVQKGDSVGYSRMGIAHEDIQVATIAIGYGDGYSRKFSNGVGKMLVRDKLAPVIGNVCMDLCMLNVTGIDVQEGDEVIVFGEKLPVNDLAKASGTISYEILTNVSERVKRVFYMD